MIAGWTAADEVLLSGGFPSTPDVVVWSSATEVGIGFVGSGRPFFTLVFSIGDRLDDGDDMETED
jgi:hypothetical protein